MSSLSNIGNLMRLYLDNIDSSVSNDTPEFLIKASARLLKEKNERNWIPLLVKETGKDKYEVIANSFIYAVAKEAGLDRVWCIIADDSDYTAEVTKVLAKEKTPKINLSTASRDEIVAALQYLIEQPKSALKTIKLAVATNRIDEAPRQYWENFDPITKLGCGITKGVKLKALEQVFYLTPEPKPIKINLSIASREQIAAALQYLIEQHGSVFKTVKLEVATNRIDEAPRQYWQNFNPIIALKCGITKGAKLEALKQVFYLKPQAMPEKDPKADVEQPKSEKPSKGGSFETMTVTELKKIAKERGITIPSKIKKDELIKALS